MGANGYPRRIPISKTPENLNSVETEMSRWEDGSDENMIDIVKIQSSTWY